ncbi:hypothetical protein HYV56_00575 [Candidatus Peregrinibacteria bacterium]|nr:hypothetical protein [Candidatus Peregrinibacteria bacterium]
MKTVKAKNKQLLTKDYLNKTLDERLKNFVTKDYLDKTLDERLKNFVTKDYLDERLKNFVTKDYLDKRFDMFWEKIQSTFVTKNELQKEIQKIYDTLEKILHILENQEWPIFKHVVTKHGENLHNHEKRIRRLEKAIQHEQSS